MTKSSEILSNASKLIAEKGWCQGTYHKRGDGYCIEGAVRAVASPEAWTSQLIGFLETAYDPGKKLDWLSRVPWMWNDTKGRTKKQVLAAFDKAIKLAKQAGE